MNTELNPAFANPQPGGTDHWQRAISDIANFEKKTYHFTGWKNLLQIGWIKLKHQIIGYFFNDFDQVFTGYQKENFTIQTIFQKI